MTIRKSLAIEITLTFLILTILLTNGRKAQAAGTGTAQSAASPGTSTASSPAAGASAIGGAGAIDSTAAGPIPAPPQTGASSGASPQPSAGVVIPAAGQTAPVLRGVIPLVVYPSPDSAGRASVNIKLIGAGLNSAADILINDNAIQVCWRSRTNRCEGSRVIATASADGRVIEVDGLSISDWHGPARVKVVLDGKESDVKQITISSVPSSTPLIGAIGFVGAIVLMIWLMVRGLRRREIAGRPYGLITTFMLDPDTGTYSLSNFQFYAWTAAAVLAYAYIALSRSLVQGNLNFIDVPDNLSKILFISAGTFGIATGVTAAKGSKGAGQIQPSWSDLLTVGGVVVPERVQFFVWTIVGVAAFLALTLFADAGSASAIPDVPMNFLYLQGISAAGYLGGKIARSQGPIISSATGRVADSTILISGANPMIIDIIGQGLSIRPGIRIADDRKIEQKIVYELPGESVAAAVGTIEVVSYDDHSLDRSFATQLRLSIRDAATVQRLTNSKEKQPAPTLSVTNPDGQSAIWPLTIS